MASKFSLGKQTAKGSFGGMKGKGKKGKSMKTMNAPYKTYKGKAPNSTDNVFKGK